MYYDFVLYSKWDLQLLPVYLTLQKRIGIHRQRNSRMHCPQSSTNQIDWAKNGDSNRRAL